MDTPKGIARLAETAPHLLGNLLLAALFIGYMHTRDEREVVSIQASSAIMSERFEQCHELQANTIETMSELAKAQSVQATEFTILISTMERLIREMRSFRQAYMEEPVTPSLNAMRVVRK